MMDRRKAERLVAQALKVTGAGKLKWKRNEYSHLVSSDGRFTIGKGPRAYWLQDAEAQDPENAEMIGPLKNAKWIAEQRAAGRTDV